MNMAAFRGVYFWEVSSERVAVTMKADGGSLHILEECARKTGCSLEILEQGGLPVFLQRVRKKQVWSAGLLCFAAGLYVLSSFVWTVETEGNERLKTEEVLSACEEMGLKPGKWKRSLQMEEIADGLLLRFSDLAWVGVGIEGTAVTIRLAEAIEQPERIDRETPCDVIASADGIIVQITAERGTPKVQPGDVVQKGDVLISSEILIGLEGEEQHTEYTAAEGMVLARVWERLSAELPLQYEEVQYSGTEKENHSVILKEKELDILRPDGAGKWEKTIQEEEKLHLGDFVLPVSLRKECWKEYEIMEKTRTVEETKRILEENLRKMSENLLSSCGKIEDIRIEFEEYAGSIRGEAEVILLDRIDEKRQER